MTPHDQSPEHEFEAAPGLPEPLPAGERLLWQGAPDWRVLARDAMHLPTLAVYFAAMLLLRGAFVRSGGGSWADAGAATLWLLPLVAAAMAMLALMAWLAARTSLYTVTDKRVVMRIGIVLSITFNLPFSKIESASLRLHGGRRAAASASGDVCLLLEPSDHIAYVHLWPHARPWHVRRTQPMLRALPNAQAVAQLLASALADTAGTVLRPVRVPAATPRPAPQAQHSGQGRTHGQQQPLAA